jgi:hypothetical protein
MPDTPLLPVIPLCKHLFYPLQYLRELKPIRRLDVERKPVVLQPQQAENELIPLFRLLKYLEEKIRCIGPAEQGFAVVDAGMDSVPDIPRKKT